LGLSGADIEQLYYDKTIVHDPLLDGTAQKPDKVRVPAID
jgi:hypothetical protein